MSGPHAHKTAPLMRSMKLLGVLFLALSAETPASSVFVIVPDVLSQAGTGALISMGVAGLIALCMAQVYAELSSAFPIAAGEYTIVGRILGALPGFVVLGLNLANTLFGSAVLALGVADYFGAILPGLAPIPTALAAVFGSTLLGVLNVRTNAFVTGAFLLVELIALAVLTGLGLAHPARSPLALIAHPQTLGPGGLVHTPAAALGLAVAVAIFAHDGYGSAVYFAEEVQAARRRIGRAIVLALLITMVAELVPLVAVLTGAPDLAKLIGAHAPFMGFVETAGGHGLAAALGAGVGLAILNAVIAMVLLSGRQLYATGRDATWAPPLDRILTLVHPRFGSPWAATLAAGRHRRPLLCAAQAAPDLHGHQHGGGLWIPVRGPIARPGDGRDRRGPFPGPGLPRDAGPGPARPPRRALVGLARPGRGPRRPAGCPGDGGRVGGLLPLAAEKARLDPDQSRGGGARTAL